MSEPAQAIRLELRAKQVRRRETMDETKTAWEEYEEAVYKAGHIYGKTKEKARRACDKAMAQARAAYGKAKLKEA